MRKFARELGVHHIVRHRRNRGLAAAFLTGLDTALKAGADVIVNTDADNQYQASYIPAITAPVLAGKADIVVGERPIESVPEFSGLKKRLQRLGSWVVRKFSGTDILDAASGFRAFDREAAMKLHVYGKYTYTMETLIQAGAEGLSVMSVPIDVNPQTRESRLVKSSFAYVSRSASTVLYARTMPEIRNTSTRTHSPPMTASTQPAVLPISRNASQVPPMLATACAMPLPGRFT